MAKTKVSDHLKEAILGLPQKEKDKLLIRLINKDELLQAQLHYKLLEDTPEDLNFRTATIKDRIKESLEKWEADSFNNLVSFLRYFGSFINLHAKITKDKKSELELWVYLMLKVSELQMDIMPLKNKYWTPSFKYQELFESRLKKIVTLLNSIHEDYKIEFEDHINLLIDRYNLL